VFYYTLWHFYAFSGTNLLTRCHSISFLFSAIFVFQKSYTGNILGIGQNKSRTSRYLTNLPEVRRGDRGGHRAATPQSGAAYPWPAPLVVRALWPTSGAAPSPIKTSQREKPKYPINFPETHCDPLSSFTRDREGPEALPGILLEIGIATGGLLHRHACLWHDEWVVYLRLWVHSSSSMVVFSTMCFMFRSRELPYMIEIIFV
jgi:hypothetical protein